jgi:hypothetical protein
VVRGVLKVVHLFKRFALGKSFGGGVGGKFMGGRNGSGLDEIAQCGQ